ncbi:alpha/beta fold hydrolase [candidate division CSSED10-310 bacterium]|uniref:Alpha/beta fold hydrolase n=1 Tax=candidate division CSSED10-310 bacterium TaxID=2855610 RepID=A0ABV6YUC3_UNCC1
MVKTGIKYSGNSSPRKKSIFIKVLIGLGALLLILIVAFSWFLLSLFSETDMAERPAYYPFKSFHARDLYYKYYDTRAQEWPVVSESKTVETSYGKTFIRISGPKNRPSLVLLPSTSATSFIWMPNIKAFSKQFRVYAVDNIYDFGRSINKRNIKSSADMMNWLDELFTALGLGNNINLIGLSFGGWLTSQYALKHPNRLTKTVWLAPAATFFEFPIEWAWRGILSALPHRYFMKKFMIEWLFEDLLKKNDASSLQQLEKFVDDAMMGLKCYKFRMPITPNVLSDSDLQHVKPPTLVLIGENEKLYSAHKVVERLKTTAPQIKIEIIPNAGHDLTIVQTEMVNSKILDFLLCHDRGPR